MGLRLTHGAFSGSPNEFNEWRAYLAKGIGIEDLKQMEYYKWPGGEPWDTYVDDPLTKLLIHSDADGVLKVQELQGIIQRMKEISAILNKDEEKERITSKFIKGATAAVEKNEVMKFYA